MAVIGWCSCFTKWKLAHFKVWIEFSSGRVSAGGASATWKPLQNPLHREESSWIGFNVSVKKMMIIIFLIVLIVFLFMLIKLIMTRLLLKVESSWIGFNVSAKGWSLLQNWGFDDEAHFKLAEMIPIRRGGKLPNFSSFTLQPACTEFHDHDTNNSELEMSDAAMIFPPVLCREHVKRKDICYWEKRNRYISIPALNTQCGKNVGWIVNIRFTKLSSCKLQLWVNAPFK